MEPYVWIFYLVLVQKRHKSVTDRNQGIFGQIGEICFSADFRQFRAEQNVIMCLIFLYLGKFSSLRKKFGVKMTVLVWQKE